MNPSAVMKDQAFLLLIFHKKGIRKGTITFTKYKIGPLRQEYY